MKKSLIIILTLIMTICMVGCSIDKESASRFKEEYEAVNGTENASGQKYREVTIDEENPIVYSTAEEIVNMINNKESFVVYFGFSTCPWCRSMVEQLIKSAKDNEQRKVYYVDVKEIRDKYELDENNNPVKAEDGGSSYSELIELMSDVLADYTLTTEDGEEISVGEKRIYAPNVVAVVKGKAKKLIEGTSSQLEDPYGELTDEMIKESYDSFNNIWDCFCDLPVCQKNAC